MQIILSRHTLILLWGHFKASNMPFREQSFQEFPKEELERKNGDLFCNSKSHHNHSQNLGGPGVLPLDKAERKLCCF